MTPGSPSPPRVFISYAWEDDAYILWVERLAARLRHDGVYARLDKWDREDGQPIPGFMLSEVEDADVVLIICSPAYKERVRAVDRNEKMSGVGWEWDVLSTTMFQTGAMDKVVAALGRGTRAEAVPAFLLREPVVDLTGADAEAEYEILFQRLTKQRPTGPPVSPNVRPVQHSPPKPLFGRSTPSSSPRHNLPPRYDRFTGRDDELASLHDALSSNDPLSLVQAPKQCLTGMGGIGKTLLALEYGYRHFMEYQKVLWVDAEGSDPSSGFAALAPLLDLRLPEDMAIPEQADKVRQALESGLCSLLILDNVDRPGACDQLLPRVGNTRVLITTRRRDLGFKAFDVDILPRGKALELLLGDLPRDEPTQAEGLALCAEFDFLTLAVDVAGKILSLGLNGPADLLAIVREKGPLKWASGADEDNLFGRKPQLGKLFETSLSLLREDTPADRLGRKMFFCGGWFAPESIPVDLLAGAALRVDTDNEKPAFASTGLDQRGARRLLALGLARSENRGQLVFHRVIRDFARKKGGVVFRAAVHDHLSVLADATDGDALKILALAPLQSHLETFLSDLSTESPQGHIQAACRIARYYLHRGQYGKAVEVVEQGQRFATEKELSAWLFHEKGNALGFLGRYNEALEHFQRSLAIKEKVLGEEHPETATTVHAIGQILHSQGRYEEALDRHQRSLAIKEKVLGEEHPETAIAVHAIGQSLHSQGRYEEALERYQRSLAISEKVLGEEHPQTASTVNAIGQTLHSQGRYEEALERYQRSLAIKEKALGEEHPETAITLHAIGQTLHRQGRYEEALERYQRSLAIKEKVLGEEHPWTASTVHAIGQTLHSQGRYEEALEHFQRDLAISEKVLGEEHPETVITLFEIGRTLRSLGEKNGEKKMRAAIKIAERILGEDHPTVQDMKSWL